MKVFYRLVIALIVVGLLFSVSCKQEPVYHEVRFNSNGGTVYMVQQVLDGERVLRVVDPVKEGFTFEGWYTDVKCTYKFDFNQPITQDMVIYAKWSTPRVVYYTVTFDAAGGTPVSPQTVQILEGELVKKPEPDPTKDGYVFLGWYYEGIVYDFALPVLMDITLTAKWEDGSSPVTESVADVTSTDSSGKTTEATKYVANSTPLPKDEETADNKTSIEIPAGELTSSTPSAVLTSVLTVTTYPLEVASSTFSVITQGDVAVAGVDCELKVSENGGTPTSVTTFTNPVTITTYILKGLSNPTVKYGDGSGVQPVFVSYDSATGKIVFTTTHFSSFFVEINSEAYIVEENYAYETLQGAIGGVKNNQTIKLLKNTEGGSGVSVEAGSKYFTINFDKFTYNVSSNPLGSVAFQFGKGNTIAMIGQGGIGGKLTSNNSSVVTLIQNYGNLTLDGVELDGAQLTTSKPYTISNNCGDVVVTGNTKIKAKSNDGVALSCNSSSETDYRDGVTVKFDNEFIGSVGPIEFDRSDETPVTKHELAIDCVTSGTFSSINIVKDTLLTNEVVKSKKNTDISLTNTKYYWVEKGDGYKYSRSEVAKIVETGTCYYTLAEAVSAAQSGQTVLLLKSTSTGSSYDANTPYKLAKAGVIIDLNGNTITETNNFSLVLGSDNMTLKNGRVVAGENVGKTCGYNSYALVVAHETSGSNISGVTIKDVTFTGGVSVGGDDETGTKGGATVDFENCAITGGDYYAIYAQKSSTANVKSGTYNKHASGVAVLSKENPANIVVIGGTYNEDPSNYTALDYAITKPINYEVYSYKKDTWSKGKAIVGGKFSSEPDSNHIAAGYMALAQGTPPETWKVVVEPDLKIVEDENPSNISYMSLSEFRNSTNASSPETYAGYTVTLLKDIDLNNTEWTPISNYAYGAGSGKLFAGTFDGGNHTISNLKVSSNTQDALGNTESVTNGFFGQVATCTIKNLKFSNANISGAGLNAVVATLHTVSTGKLVMKNVQVLSGSVTNTNNAGGLMCFCTGWASFEDCVNYASVSGYGTGGIVGILRDNTATNTVTILNCTNYGTITNTVGTGDGAGGIVSKIQYYGIIKKCKNYGAVSGTVGNVYAGGILGLVGGNKTFSIEDCINYGNVTSDAGEYGRAGGIMGKFAGAMTILRCSNTGNITGYQGAGGINGWGGDSGGLSVYYCYNSGVVVSSHGTAGGIDQGEYTQTVGYSLNAGSVSCAEGKNAWKIASSSSTINSCYYYDGSTLKDNSGAASEVDAALSALNNSQPSSFWGKDRNNIIKPLALIQNE